MRTKLPTISAFAVFLQLSLITACLQAATFTVTNTNNAGPGSLRAAITIANGNASADVVEFALGNSVQTITLTSGPIEISSEITIDAPRAFEHRVRVSGDNSSGIFEIRNTPDPVTINNLTIRDSANESAIVIESGANVRLDNCSVRNNSDNGAIGAKNGGGVESDDATFVAENCTFQANVAGNDGGALYFRGNNSVATLLNTTVVDNQAEGFGGGINVSHGTVTAINCTITGNTADSDADDGGSGGGVFSNGVAGAELIAQNCLFAENSDLSPTSIVEENYSGLVISGGNNFIDERDGPQFSDGSNNDIVGASGSPHPVQLAPIQNNGGIGGTRLPLSGSLVIDAGDSAAITDPPFSTDRTIINRPAILDGRLEPRVNGAAVDIGAVEQSFQFHVDNADDSGAGSLRRAIEDANVVGEGRIVFSSLFIFGPPTITLATPIDITSALTVTTYGEHIPISGGHSTRLFNITASGADKVSFAKLQLMDGAEDEAAILHISGATTQVCFDTSILENSHATDASGDGGGAMIIDDATVEITDSVMHGNLSQSDGGAIVMRNNADMTVINATLSNNRANRHGGGIHNSSGLAVLTHATITDNTADLDNNSNGAGGGISTVSSGTIEVRNSIIAGNASGLSADGAGTGLTSLGHNLIGVGVAGFVDGVNGDQVGSVATPLDPMLEALADNGVNGTLTHHLLAGSPAIDAGDNANAPTADQRGQVRPFNTTVDIGAYERPRDSFLSIAIFDPVPAGIGEDEEPIHQIAFDPSLPGFAAEREFEIDPASTATVGIDFTISSSDPITDLGNGRYRMASFNSVLDVAIVPDAEVESDETIIINLVETADYEIDPGAANGNSVSITIVDDDIKVTNSNDFGPGSLRDAIHQVGQNGGGGVCVPANFPPITVTTPLTIDGAIRIDGNGSMVQGSGSLGVFAVLGSGTPGVECAVLEDLIITGGNGPAGGGGIMVIGQDTCLEIIRCAITGNSTSASGGGIHINDADVTVRQSSVDNNTADVHGGGIYVSGVDAGLTVVNSTLGQNTCAQAGGAIYLIDGDCNLHHATVTENICDSDNDGTGNGGGINHATGSGHCELKNSIVAGNTDTAGIGNLAPDLFGVVISSGSNLIGDNNTVTFTHTSGTPNANGDYVGSNAAPLDAMLTSGGATPLAYTFHHDSFAYNNGDDSVVAPPLYDADLVDQNGDARTFGVSVDIGAVEMDYLVVLTTANAGPGTLRERILFAAGPGRATIVFDSTTFATPQTITLTSGELLVNGTMTICAPDHGVTLDAAGNSRVMNIAPTNTGADIALKNLTMREGGGVTNGGALIVSGDPVVKIECCIIEDNSPTFGGGGIFLDDDGAACELRMLDTTLRHNDVPNSGGGLGASSEDKVIAERCTIYDNTAGTSGAGMDFDHGELMNTTISGNVAGEFGGGIIATFPADIELIHCTVVNNRCGDGGTVGDGGGIKAFDAITLQSTIVAENTDGSSAGSGFHHDYSGGAVSLGSALIGDSTGSFGITNTDGNLLGDAANPLSPLLGPLGTNGGKTLTHRPLLGSPVIDNGQLIGGFPDTDQTGNDRSTNGVPDIGAVEFIPQKTLVAVIDTTAHESGNDTATLSVIRDATDGDLDVPLRIEAVPTAASFEDFDFVVDGGSGSVVQDAVSATVTIPAGQTSVLLRVVPVDDTTYEGPEILQVHTEAGAFSQPGQVTPPDDITIQDNDFMVTDYGDSGPGTLRDAIATLEASGGGAITIDNTIVDGVPRPATITLSSQLVVSGTLAICGPRDNAAGITISGGGNVRIFEAVGTARLTLKDLTLSEGFANGGALFLRDSAEGTLVRCTLTNNHSDFNGGAVDSTSSATLTASNCTFSGNTANISGGAIRALNTDITLLNCTFCLNSADFDSDNNGDGGAIDTTNFNSVSLRNTLICASTPTNVFGPLTSDGGNLVDVDTGLIMTAHPTDQIGTTAAPVDPLIDELRMNGGPVSTHALLLASPAIDTGGNTHAPGNDARSLTRIFNGKSDIGAYEHQYVTYEFWRGFMFPIDPSAEAGGVYDLAFDFDADGTCNGVERLFGTSPILAEPDPITGTPINDDLVMEFPLEMTVDPNRLGIEFSSDVSDWTLVATPPQVVGQHGDGARLLRVHIPSSSDPRVFARVVHLP